MIIIKGLTEYVEKELASVDYDKILLEFQKSLVEEGQDMERRTKKAGLSDEGVLLDLFKSKHTDLKTEYAGFRKTMLRKNSEKNRHKLMLIATPIYFIIMTIVYLTVSFYTQNWAQSWLIIIGFVTVFVDTVGLTAVMEIASKRKLLHPIARIALGLSVMMTAACIFLIGNTLFYIPDFWVVFPGGVFVLLVCDAVFAYKTKQILRNINYIIYIVACAAMLYVILGGIHVIPWNPGWIMVPLSLIIDAIYITARLIHNRKYIYRPEDAEE